MISKKWPLTWGHCLTQDDNSRGYPLHNSIIVLLFIIWNCLLRNISSISPAIQLEPVWHHYLSLNPTLLRIWWTFMGLFCTIHCTAIIANNRLSHITAFLPLVECVVVFTFLSSSALSSGYGVYWFLTRFTNQEKICSTYDTTGITLCSLMLKAFCSLILFSFLGNL